MCLRIYQVTTKVNEKIQLINFIFLLLSRIRRISLTLPESWNGTDTETKLILQKVLLKDVKEESNGSPGLCFPFPLLEIQFFSIYYKRAYGSWDSF